MKTRNFLLAGIITLSGMLILSSCEKDDESIADEPATEAEAAEMVAYSLSEGTSGTASDIETAAALANVAVDSLNCGESADTTIVTSAGSSLTHIAGFTPKKQKNRLIIH